jgi:hypothetical protein
MLDEVLRNLRSLGTGIFVWALRVGGTLLLSILIHQFMLFNLLFVMFDRLLEVDLNLFLI